MTSERPTEHGRCPHCGRPFVLVALGGQARRVCPDCQSAPPADPRTSVPGRGRRKGGRDPRRGRPL